MNRYIGNSESKSTRFIPIHSTYLEVEDTKYLIILV